MSAPAHRGNDGRAGAAGRCIATVLLGFGLSPVAWAEAIAVIKSYDFAPYDAATATFVDTCADDIKQYNLRGEADDHSAIIQGITLGKPELIVAVGVLAAEFAQQKLSGFAVLYVMVPNPRSRGLTGNNIAGISLDIPVDRQFSVYRSMVPALQSLGVIYDPANSQDVIDEAQRIAEAQGLVLRARPVSSRKDVPKALRALLRDEKIDALWMIPDETVVTPESFKFLLLTSFESQLPFLAASDIFVKVGALASLMPDYEDLGRQGCELATGLTNGKLSMASLNVVPPAKVNLSINLKTARKIGLSIPPEIVETADAVYR